MKNLLRILRSLSDETRLRMLALLVNQECCVCQVMEVLGISQTRASRNLQVLYAAGLLQRRKEGLWTYYSIDKTGLGKSAGLLMEALGVALSSDRQVKADRKELSRHVGAGGKCCR